jgi:hypothetical protein
MNPKQKGVKEGCNPGAPLLDVKEKKNLLFA